MLKVGAIIARTKQQEPNWSHNVLTLVKRLFAEECVLHATMFLENRGKFRINYWCEIEIFN
jgi:hypothetical protein